MEQMMRSLPKNLQYLQSFYEIPAFKDGASDVSF